MTMFWTSDSMPLNVIPTCRMASDAAPSSVPSNRAPTTGEEDATDDRSRETGQQRVPTRGRIGSGELEGDDDAGAGGDESRDHEAGEHPPAHGDTRIAGRLPVATHRVELPPDANAGEEDVHGDERQDEDEHPRRELADERLAEVEREVLVRHHDRFLVGDDERHASQEEQHPERGDEGVDAHDHDEEGVDGADDETDGQRNDDPDRDVVEAGHHHAGHRQDAGDAEVELAHQDHRGQPDRGEADQGESPEGHLIGGEHRRLPDEGPDQHDDEQDHGSALGPPSERRLDPTDQVLLLVAEVEGCGLRHELPAFRARASTDTASTIRAPIAICW